MHNGWLSQAEGVCLVWSSTSSGGDPSKDEPSRDGRPDDWPTNEVAESQAAEQQSGESRFRNLLGTKPTWVRVSEAGLPNVVIRQVDDTIVIPIRKAAPEYGFAKAVPPNGIVCRIDHPVQVVIALQTNLDLQ